MTRRLKKEYLVIILGWFFFSPYSRWKNGITFFPNRGSNPVRWTRSPTLYHVTIKAGLYRKAVQVYHTPITTTYSPSILRLVHESLFEQPLNIRPPSLLDYQAHQMGLFTLGAWCNRWKNSNHQCCSRGSNPGRLRDRQTLYCVAIKAGLYRKAVQVYHIPIPGDIHTNVCCGYSSEAPHQISP